MAIYMIDSNAAMSNKYVIGVDGGGSKTAAVILDNAGNMLGRAVSGSSNYHNVGMRQAEKSLATVMDLALQDAKVTLANVVSVTWALAGVDRPSERVLFSQLAAKILPDIPTRVENDAVAALVAGVGFQAGVALIAGTGMIAYGINDAGNIARAGGWGYLIDEGSGFQLVQSTLQQIARAFDADARFDSNLTSVLLSETQTESIPDLLSWLYERKRPVREIATLAPAILNAAEQADQLAVAAVHEGAQALARVVQHVAHKLNFSGQFPLVFSGGLLVKSDFYRSLVVQSLRTLLPEVDIVVGKVDAAVGAAYLAWQAVGLTLQVPGHTEAPATDRVWTTEQQSVLTPDLHLYNTLSLSHFMHSQDKQAVAAVGATLPTITRAVESIIARVKRGGRIIYIGAGTSGRLGVLDASECPPTFSVPPEKVLGIIAGGPKALQNSIEGAEDDKVAGINDLEAHELSPLDSVIGISASGRTPYVLAALAHARQRGCLTIGLCTNKSDTLAQYSDFLISPLVGPEILAGSTRLKSGTAQKLVLNMLSTITMIQLGKSYRNLMVDVHASNSKLRARAIRIVAAACGLEPSSAKKLLLECDGNVKSAIVSHTLNITPVDAMALLAQADGNIGLVMSELHLTTPE